MSPRGWVGVVSRAHVLRGAAGGFGQLCHGKHAPLARMQVGDWLAYYSPTTEFRGGTLLRAFTALARVTGESVYQVDLGGGFHPVRRDLTYVSTREVALRELSDRLLFTQDPSWGMLARRGHFALDPADLDVIADAMGVRLGYRAS